MMTNSLIENVEFEISLPKVEVKNNQLIFCLDKRSFRCKVFERIIIR